MPCDFFYVCTNYMLTTVRASLELKIPVLLKWHDLEPHKLLCNGPRFQVFCYDNTAWTYSYTCTSTCMCTPTGSLLSLILSWRWQTVPIGFLCLVCSSHRLLKSARIGSWSLKRAHCYNLVSSCIKHYSAQPHSVTWWFVFSGSPRSHVPAVCSLWNMATWWKRETWPHALGTQYKLSWSLWCYL